MTRRSAEVLNDVNAVPHDGPAAEDSGTSILAVLIILARRKLLIAGTTLILAVVAATRVTLMRDNFKAAAIILPPQQQQSSLAAFAAGTLGNLAGSGMASQLGLKNPADIYIGILKSQTISDSIISQFHLQDIYNQKFLSDTRIVLRKHATFTSGKDSLITITVEDHDPKRAAAIANAFVDELYKLNSRLAITDAWQRRLFFEQRLSKEKDALSQAEVALKRTQQSTGLVVPSAQAEALVRSASQLRAEIASREVDLQTARSYATDQNPRIQVLQREISTMQDQLSQLASDGGQGPSFEVSAGKLPQANLESIRKFRDLKYHETLYELLAKQYEAAAIDEAHQAPVIQIIDHAQVPDKRSAPSLVASMVEFGLLGFVLSSLYVCAVDRVKSMLSDPSQAENLASLRSASKIYQPN